MLLVLYLVYSIKVPTHCSSDSKNSLDTIYCHSCKVFQGLLIIFLVINVCFLKIIKFINVTHNKIFDFIHITYNSTKRILSDKTTI